MLLICERLPDKMMNMARKKKTTKSEKKTSIRANAIGTIIIFISISIAFLYGIYYQLQQIDQLKVGLIVELSGERSAIGISSKNAAELAVAELNRRGGIDAGGARRKVRLIIYDNKSDVNKTVEGVKSLVQTDRVSVIIGPNASKFAIPAAAKAEELNKVLISPWSTDIKTTLTKIGKPKKFVFRVAYTDIFQGSVLAKFAFSTLKSKRVAILYDSSSDVLKGQADIFSKTFKLEGGKIVAEETYKSGDKDFTNQLTRIKNTNPDLIFLPSYYDLAPAQIKQAHKLGIKAPFLGTDAWGNEQLLQQCGIDCEGYYFSSHFAADSTAPMTKTFVAQYNQLYGTNADDVAALTYDAFGMLDAISGINDFQSSTIRDALSGLARYEGVTGNIRYEGTGDPIKSTMIMKISKGKFVWFSEARP